MASGFARLSRFRLLDLVSPGVTRRFLKLFFGVWYVMAKNIYVGNLPWSATEEEVRAAFETFGEVISVKLINDRETGRPRGFGFVEMEDQGALAAIESLDGSDFGGRNIKVNEARPRPERPRW
jgi:hypothetical protein